MGGGADRQFSYVNAPFGRAGHLHSCLVGWWVVSYAKAIFVAALGIYIAELLGGWVCGWGAADRQFSYVNAPSCRGGHLHS